MEVVLIVLGALALILLVWAVAKRQRERRLEARREEAGELRETARRHELQAREHARAAAEIDPDTDTDGDSAPVSRDREAERTSRR
jgi:hypothetical protein